MLSEEEQPKGEQPQAPAEVAQPAKKIKVKEAKKKKPFKIVLTVLGILILLAIAAFLVWYFLLQEKPVENEEIAGEETEEVEPEKEKYYSVLTGLEIKDSTLNNSPVYCVQVPNGTDGARPQAGLNEAGVIFEAIAERGITRFAVLFQNPKTSVIGPIRSLRMYYLEWDTPFDCTITHAGGADDALAAVRAGGYRDFTENYNYMWRGATSTSVNRKWNNLFTSADYLASFNNNKGYNSSNVTGFTHLKPEESEKNRIDSLAVNKLDIDTETDKSTKELAVQASKITLRFGNMANYNPVYTYDVETNTYFRGYESGMKHVIYNCAEGMGEVTPELACGEPTQLHPSVVIAMTVQESLASDGYHENITTIGSGKAVVFQNGMAIKGVWQKKSRADQIKFYDEDGKEISLAPGQAIVSAIPASYSGSGVFYE